MNLAQVRILGEVEYYYGCINDGMFSWLINSLNSAEKLMDYVNEKIDLIMKKANTLNIELSNEIILEVK